MYWRLTKLAQDCKKKLVLILLLMDYVLEVDTLKSELVNDYVLILLLMDYVLEVKKQIQL